jgi:positive regulator of sigma E activity
MMFSNVFQNPSRSLNDWRDSSMWASSLKNAVLIYLWEVFFFFSNALLHYEKNNDENIVSGVPIYYRVLGFTSFLHYKLS